jgi:hypothetical protein
MKKIAIIALLAASSMAHAQDNDETRRIIHTSLPFLNITPDARSSGMGEVGAATSPDAWAMYWNPSKYAFTEDKFGVGIAYTPWLRNLGVKDINLAYLSAYYKIDDLQTIGFATKFMNMGTVHFRDEIGTSLGEFTPKDFSFDIAYARKLSDKFSMSVAGRYVNSNLTGGHSAAGQAPSKPARAVAGDVSGYYSNKRRIYGYPANLSFGFNISNIGNKVSYNDSGKKYFLPTNLRLGLGGSIDVDDFNNIGLYGDMNKLLVPTPPVMGVNEEGERVILRGKDNDVGTAAGIFQSFSDAPDGFSEEIREIAWSLGLEYWYAKQFAVRGGYYTESQTKGNRKWMQFGVGLKLTTFGLDVSYMVPTEGRQSALARTFRFALTFDIGGLNSQAKQ